MTMFGRRVKKRLIDLNMSQTELAEQLGIAPQYLWRIMVGDRPGDEYCERIKTILEIEDGKSA